MCNGFSLPTGPSLYGLNLVVAVVVFLSTSSGSSMSGNKKLFFFFLVVVVPQWYEWALIYFSSPTPLAVGFEVL